MKLFNPTAPKGANIEAQFVAMEDEKRDSKENVVNAEQIRFAAGSHLECDEKMGKYILKQWGFVEEVEEMEEIKVEQPKPEVVPEGKESQYLRKDLENMKFPKLREIYGELTGKKFPLGTTKKEVVDLILN